MKYFTNSGPPLVSSKFCSPLENKAEKGNGYFEWDSMFTEIYPKDKKDYLWIYLGYKVNLHWSYGETLFRHTATVKLLQYIPEVHVWFSWDYYKLQFEMCFGFQACIWNTSNWIFLCPWLLETVVHGFKSPVNWFTLFLCVCRMAKS